jgi:predicted anti-sigma-YlaC factor YlaD
MIDLEAVTCQELVELVTDYLEGSLAPADLRRFEEHLAVCMGCQTYLDQLRTTIEATGTLTLDDLTPEAESELLHAFRTWHAAPTAPDR